MHLGKMGAGLLETPDETQEIAIFDARLKVALEVGLQERQFGAARLAAAQVRQAQQPQLSRRVSGRFESCNHGRVLSQFQQVL
mgnify:CR=1 FL=1